MPVTARKGGSEGLPGVPLGVPPPGAPGGPTAAAGVPAGEGTALVVGPGVTDAVGVLVGTEVVSVGDGAGLGVTEADSAQLALVIVLVSKVTAPLRASNLPWNVAAV